MYASMNIVYGMRACLDNIYSQVNSFWEVGHHTGPGVYSAEKTSCMQKVWLLELLIASRGISVGTGPGPD